VPSSVRLIADEKHLMKSKKPFAYVEYETADMATNNLNALNGSQIGETQIKVDRSRVQTTAKSAQFAASLGGARKPKLIGGRSLALNLVPRAVAGGASTSAAALSAPTGEIKKPMASNDDFRALLFSSSKRKE
jgi:RNA recognition motif-containing protein